MEAKHNTQKSDLFFSSIIRGTGILILLKIIAVIYAYGYLLPQMGRWRSLYFFLLLLQWEILTLGCLVLLTYIRNKYSQWRIQWGSWVGWFLAFSMMLWDVLAIGVYQQRFSWMMVMDMRAGLDGVIARYMFGAVMLALVLLIGVWRLAISRPLRVEQEKLLLLVFLTFLIKLLPFPLLQVAVVELPVQSVFSHRLKKEFQIDLDFYRPASLLLEMGSEQLNINPSEKQQLQKKKEIWLRFAEQNPDRIFEEFSYGGLTKAYDGEGKSYIGEILAKAIEQKPELAFIHLDVYKDWRSDDGQNLVKSTLMYAIEQKPELAFQYLSIYEDLVVDNQKIAKDLLEYAAHYYQNKFSFKDFYVQEAGRNNKKNLILLFWESASSVDSKEFGGLYDRFPLTDEISRSGTRFTKMLANGTTSEMGHIATLMGVEPMYFGGGQRVSYENVTNVVSGLGSFFTDIGYAVHFVSTASLDFLNQRKFLTQAGYSQFIEKDFWDWKKYVFDAEPDEALYQKTLDIVKSQTSPYFITLQSISSHIPYNTPYGRSEEGMYRYMDESFSKFYKGLQEMNFFDDGILLVIGDHRKMTPLEPEEFDLWGNEADAKIIAFMVGSGIEAKVDGNLYQQIDVFNSLRKEFGKLEGVVVLRMMNDIFISKIQRHRWLRNFLGRERVNVLGEGFRQGVVRTDTSKFIQGEADFNADEVLNYINYALKYQKEKNQISDAVDRVYLISHRGETKKHSENSLEAFLAASKAGADGLEFDVNYTKDGHLIVFHGPKLYGTQCQERSHDVCELSWSQIQNCLYEKGEKIRLLSEVLPEIKGLFPMYFLDFKSSENPACKQDVKALFVQAQHLVEAEGMQKEVTFSTYDKNLTEQLAGDQYIQSALDTFEMEDMALLRRGTFRYFMAPLEKRTRQYLNSLWKIENLNGEEVKAVAYTVNTKEEFEKVTKMGLRYLMTDELELLIPLRNKFLP